MRPGRAAAVSLLPLLACMGVSACVAPAAGTQRLPGTASPRTRVLGSGPRVLVAQVLLPPGARFTLPTSVCQDVLVHVRRGVAELPGGRVLLPGRAVRFGLDGAAVSNTSPRDSELYVIVSRSVARRFGPDATLDMQLAPADPACGEGALAAALSDLAAEPFVHAEGTVRVSILLDEAGQGARHASLSHLSANASAGVPLHEHEDSAEVIFIEQGEGRMRVGDQHVSVRPGTFVYIPPHTPHSFTPSGNAPLEALQVYAPAGPEQRFRTSPVAPQPNAEGEAPIAPDTAPGSSPPAASAPAAAPVSTPPAAGSWQSAPASASHGDSGT